MVQQVSVAGLIACLVAGLYANLHTGYTTVKKKNYFIAFSRSNSIWTNKKGYISKKKQ